MAELDYLLPLRVQRPVFDYGGVLSQAADIKGRNLANEGQATTNALSALRLGEATDQNNALEAFRAATAAGDPSAPDKLAGFPDVQVQVYDALDRMADRDRQAAVRRGLRIAEAAKTVAGLPEGSPERVTAWNEQLGLLHKKGDITEEQYKTFYGNPSDLIIDQALSLGQTVEQFIADRAARRPKRYGDLSIAEKLKIDDEINKRAKAGLSDWDTVDETEMAGRRRRARDEVLREYGITSDPFDSQPNNVAAGPVKTTAGGGAAKVAPMPGPEEIARPASQEEFDALPSGAYFVNPATGAVMRKR